MKIRQTFENSKSSLFIPFIMSGHPTKEDSTKALIALSEIGADIIELGVPFSDPAADGPTNEHAAHISLQNGTNIKYILEQVSDFRKLGHSVPIIMFSYLNPLLAYGIEKLAKDAKNSGINAFLIVDLPPEEGTDNIYKTLMNEGLEIILLASPTTDIKRLEKYKELSPGFIYYISRLSVTGAQKDLSSTLEQEVLDIRKHTKDIPVSVGFGISTPEHAKKVSSFADGVIVGSVLVKTLETKGIEEFSKIADSLSKAVHMKDE